MKKFKVEVESSKLLLALQFSYFIPEGPDLLMAAGRKGSKLKLKVKSCNHASGYFYYISEGSNFADS